ncbi:MAG: hypothetical protein AB7F43_09565 [Bacteriovoracia bacterium]
MPSYAVRTLDFELDAYLKLCRTKHLWEKLAPDARESLERKEYHIRNEIVEHIFKKINEKDDFAGYKEALQKIGQKAETLEESLSSDSEAESVRSDLLTIWDLSNKLNDEWLFHYGDTLSRGQRVKTQAEQIGVNVGSIVALGNFTVSGDFAGDIKNILPGVETTAQQLQRASAINPILTKAFFDLIRKTPGVMVALVGATTGTLVGKIYKWTQGKKVPPAPAQLLRFGVKDQDDNYSEDDLATKRAISSTLAAWVTNDLFFIVLRGLQWLGGTPQVVAEAIGRSGMAVGATLLYGTAEAGKKVSEHLKENRREELTERFLAAIKRYQKAKDEHDFIGTITASDEIVYSASKLATFLNLDVEIVPLTREASKEQVLALADAYASMGFNSRNPYPVKEYLCELAVRTVDKMTEQEKIVALQKFSRPTTLLALDLKKKYMKAYLEASDKDAFRQEYMNQLRGLTSSEIMHNPIGVLMTGYAILIADEQAFIRDRAEILFESASTEYWIYLVAKYGKRSHPATAAFIADVEVLRGSLGL